MFTDFIEKVKKIVVQYEEGAIFAEEAFNAIIAKAGEILESEEYTEHLETQEKLEAESDRDE